MIKTSLEKVYKYIDAHANDFVEDLVKLVKQPDNHPEANTHAPDENLEIESFIKGTKFVATFSDFAQ
jgi:acetylornithine deacetylase/succinyl-diaminopimelate desuccinylase-like protein